jgi:hypothetical protein
MPSKKATAELTHDIVAVNLTADSLAYANELLYNGTTGDSVNRSNPLMVNPNIRALVDAMYEVFAGGSVNAVRDGSNRVTSITVSLGALAKYQDLQKMEADCTTAINTINHTAGYVHAIEF